MHPRKIKLCAMNLELYAPSQSHHFVMVQTLSIGERSLTKIITDLGNNETMSAIMGMAVIPANWPTFYGESSPTETVSKIMMRQKILNSLHMV